MSRSNKKSKDAGYMETYADGHSCEEMTPFEKNLVMKERQDRARAKIEYQIGIQGSDGGKGMHQFQR